MGKVTSTREVGRKGGLVVMGSTFMLMGRSMRDGGRMISRVEEERRCGEMEVFMKGSIIEEISMEKVK